VPAGVAGGPLCCVCVCVTDSAPAAGLGAWRGGGLVVPFARKG
jgi:hypothetical protein